MLSMLENVQDGIKLFFLKNDKRSESNKTLQGDKNVWKP